MVTINQLSTAQELNSGDLIPVYKSSDGDARKSSINLLKSYMQDNLSFSTNAGVFTSQYFAPSETGFSVPIVSVSEENKNVHLIMIPTGTLAAGTIVLPVHTNLVDKQEVLVNSTQAVTTLTVSGNGATISGSPNALIANDFFKLKYDVITNTWFRIG